MSEVDRTSYIGGPTAAAIAGVSPWQTPVQAWQILTRRQPGPDLTAIMRGGQLLEPSVLTYASEELGFPVLPGPYVRDPSEPLGGHLDGIKEDRSAIIEAKTGRGRNGWGEPGTDQVPAHVAAQVLHYMGLVPEARVAYVPVLFSGLEFAMYQVPRDDATIAALRELCLRWWRDYILTDTPPPPTSGADAALLFPRDTGAVAIADDATAEALDELRAVRHQIKVAEEIRDTLEGRIKLAMADASVLTVNGDVAATWKVAVSNRFDSSALKLAQPELYKQFTRPQESRRFLIKGVE